DVPGSGVVVGTAGLGAGAGAGSFATAGVVSTGVGSGVVAGGTTGVAAGSATTASVPNSSTRPWLPVASGVVVFVGATVAGSIAGGGATAALCVAVGPNP